METSAVECSDIALNRWRFIATDDQTKQTSLEWVFAGGDCSPDDHEMIAVHAIADGRRAAMSIHQYLSGQPVVGEGFEWYSMMGGPKDPPPRQILERITPSERARMPTIPDEQRLQGFAEIELGFSLEDGRQEAERCRVCGCLAVGDCKLKEYGTEYRIQPERLRGTRRDYYLDDSHEKLIIESGKCILCGSCVRVCALEGKDVLGFVGRGFNTMIMPTLGRRLADTACDGCLKCAEVCPTGAIQARPGVTSDV